MAVRKKTRPLGLMPIYQSAPDRLPPHAQQLLAACPASGSGSRAVHRWIIEAANHLRHHVPADQAADLIMRHISRRPEPGEIEEAIEKAYGVSRGQVPKAQRLPTWPEPNLEFIENVVSQYAKAGKVAELTASSPVPIPATTDQIIAQLFPSDNLLCLAVDPRYPIVAPLARLKDLHRFELIVPSPMSAEFWTDAKGKRHDRGLENTGPRRFIVTDFDFKPTDKSGRPRIYAPLIADWQSRGLSPQDAMAGIVTYLAIQGPLTMVVFSGNVSLQAWWYCAGERENPGSQLRKFFAVARALGADSQGWTTCQFFRTPGAVRHETRRRQDVLFFNPQFVNSDENNSQEVAQK